jgi:hypothetical protein
LDLLAGAAVLFREFFGPQRPGLVADRFFAHGRRLAAAATAEQPKFRCCRVLAMSLRPVTNN